LTEKAPYKSCASLKTTSTLWCRVPPRFKAYLEADRAEEAQRLLSSRRPGASGVPCRGARLGAVSEHAYSAVAEYVSFDWIRKEIPVRLDGEQTRQAVPALGGTASGLDDGVASETRQDRFEIGDFPGRAAAGHSVPPRFRCSVIVMYGSGRARARGSRARRGGAAVADAHPWLRDCSSRERSTRTIRSCWH
jgi:hypothetical protein